MKKNILLITSDQHHHSLMGYNNPQLKTPNLDRLAAEGRVFDRAYCPNPTCTPSRASIITGMYPSQHGAWTLGTKLPEDAPVVGDVFKEAGYRTGLIGKAHFQPIVGTEEFPSLESREVLGDLDFWRSFDDTFYGFEDIDLNCDHGNSGAGQHYALWLEEKGLTNWRDYFKPSVDHVDGFVWNLPEEYHYDNWIAERAAARLEAYKERGENFYARPLHRQDAGQAGRAWTCGEHTGYLHHRSR
jgi:arylsulfatase A-like enzyme